MSSSHDDHGSTPAAWTAVTIVMVAFVVGAVGIVMAEAWVVVLGFVLILVGVVIGKVMQMMGMGAQRAET